MAKPREGYHDMFTQIPEALWQALNEEAARSMRNATTQLIWILQERYPHAAEPVGPAKKKRRRKL
jgi:hypothetical protein